MSQPEPAARDKRVTQTRIISSAIAGPIVVAMMWFDWPVPWFTVLAVVWGLGSLNEFYRLIRHSRGISPLFWFGLLWSSLIIISPHFTRVPHFAVISPMAALITTAVVIPLLVLLWRPGKEQAFAAWAWTVAGILYIGWLLSNCVALRNLEDGRGWLFMAILCTFASDSTAYFAGRAWGKHKLAPYVSPKKSWEGTLAGIAAAIVAGVILGYLFHLPIAWWQVVLLGFLISVFGQLGDLVKSLFKRNMEVKDSGRALPGHGGFLDRMDSLAFAGMTVYFFVAFIT